MKAVVIDTDGWEGDLINAGRLLKEGVEAREEVDPAEESTRPPESIDTIIADCVGANLTLGSINSTLS